MPETLSLPMLIGYWCSSSQVVSGCQEHHVRVAAWLQSFLVRALMAALAVILIMLPCHAAQTGRLLAVGPLRGITSIAEAAKVARDGDVIEVDAGDYVRDVAVWSQARISLRAVGGRVRLLAGGAAAEDKAIWVVRAGEISVEGFDFIGAVVPDRNGAGIRFEQGSLLIRDCRFLENQNGILSSGNPAAMLVIENSEFGYNGFGDGQSHNLYVGAIASLKVSGSYFHHARVGHLLKSRAAENFIFYNRLSDETGGQASYELEFPNGGLAYVLGNVIQQSSTTENPHIVAFGAEGYKASTNKLYLVNNTLIDMRPRGGRFLRVNKGAEVIAINNLLLGEGFLETEAKADFRNNFKVDFEDFVLAVREDFHLKTGSRLIGKAIAVSPAGGVSLTPTAGYRHPRSLQPIRDGALSPGAMQ